MSVTWQQLRDDPDLRARILAEHRDEIERALDVATGLCEFHTIRPAGEPEWTRRDPRVRPFRDEILEHCVDLDISAQPVLAFWGYRVGTSPGPVAAYCRYFAQMSRPESGEFDRAWSKDLDPPQPPKRRK